MILCDMDGVLATGLGRDTTPGEPIYRTFTEAPDELELIRAAGIPFHVVTAKVEAEAAQVLDAIGLHPRIESIIGANRLFWPSVWAAARKGRLPESLAKSVYRRVLPTPQGARIIMLEDRQENLHEMLAAGAIDRGVLVPPISVSGGRIVEWFDVNLAFRVARGLAMGSMSAADLTRLDISIHRWHEGDLEPLDPADAAGILEGERYLLRLPGLSFDGSPSAGPSLESLDTGRVLMAGRRDLVTTVRAGRRVVRRIVRRLSGSGGGGRGG